MKIEKVNINDLISPAYNPRDITPAEMEKLKTSITEFGYVDPIIVNEVNMHIVGGNQRYEALKELGYDEVDVVYVHEKDENREKALNIALNKISGTWDEFKLNQIFEDMQLNHFEEIKLTGFEDYEIQQIGFKNDIEFDEDLEDIYEEPEDGRKYKEIDEDDFDFNEEIEVTVKKGDLYKLGNNYLLCGDIKNIQDIKTLINDAEIDCLLLDPPYDYTDFSYINSLDDFLHDVNILHMNKDTNLIEYLKQSPFKFKQFLVNTFDKKIPIFKNPYLQHIIISREIKGQNEMLNLHDSFGSVIYTDYRNLNEEENIISHSKSIHLFSELIQHYCNETLFDCFGGGGTSLIVCEQLDKKCYMMEIEPLHCQLIINRWEKFTESKAVKIN